VFLWLKIALATKQEGVAGGIDVAISWGVRILTGIALSTLASTSIGIAMVVIGASFGGSLLFPPNYSCWTDA
jgi:hypothetical protein